MTPRGGKLSLENLPAPCFFQSTRLALRILILGQGHNKVFRLT